MDLLFHLELLTRQAETKTSSVLYQPGRAMVATPGERLSVVRVGCVCGVGGGGGWGGGGGTVKMRALGRGMGQCHIGYSCKCTVWSTGSNLAGQGMTEQKEIVHFFTH